MTTPSRPSPSAHPLRVLSKRTDTPSPPVLPKRTDTLLSTPSAGGLDRWRIAHSSRKIEGCGAYSAEEPLFFLLE
jgi:hypothetical protein